MLEKHGPCLPLHRLLACCGPLLRLKLLKKQTEFDVSSPIVGVQQDQRHQGSPVRSLVPSGLKEAKDQVE